MARGEATSLQAKTGYGFRFYYEKKTVAGARTASTYETVDFVEIEGMKSGALPSPEKPEIDVTTTTDRVKAYIPGIGSINDISLEFNFYPENDVHQDLVTNVLYDDDPRWWRITGQGMTFIFLGYLKSANASFGVDAAITLPLVLKVTSDPCITFPPAPPPVEGGSNGPTCPKPTPPTPPVEGGDTNPGGGTGETGTEQSASAYRARSR